MKDKKTKVIDATKGMVLLPGLEEEHEHEGGGAKNTIMNMILTYGSHHIVPWRWWSRFVISWWQLIQIRKKTFEKNAQAYLEEIRGFGSSLSGWLERCETKEFCNPTRGFPLLGLDYGLNQVAISGISPDSEPSAARLRELTEYIKKKWDQGHLLWGKCFEVLSKNFVFWSRCWVGCLKSFGKPWRIKKWKMVKIMCLLWRRIWRR